MSCRFDCRVCVWKRRMKMKEGSWRNVGRSWRMKELTVKEKLVKVQEGFVDLDVRGRENERMIVELGERLEECEGKVKRIEVELLSRVEEVKERVNRRMDCVDGEIENVVDEMKKLCERSEKDEDLRMEKLMRMVEMEEVMEKSFSKMREEIGEVRKELELLKKVEVMKEDVEKKRMDVEVKRDVFDRVIDEENFRSVMTMFVMFVGGVKLDLDATLLNGKRGSAVRRIVDVVEKMMKSRGRQVKKVEIEKEVNEGIDDWRRGKNCYRL